MGAIWTERNRYRKWLDVELAVCEAWSELGEIPPKALEQIKKKASFSVKRIEEIEKVVKHDVIAFLTSVAEKVGKDARYIHLGLTSMMLSIQHYPFSSESRWKKSKKTSSLSKRPSNRKLFATKKPP